MTRCTRMRSFVKSTRLASITMDMPRTPPPIVYVECDLPEGMTLDAWRRSRATTPKPTPARRARRAGSRLTKRLRTRS